MAQFRAKARAVDLLGKGQIADLPTAISELWKNGYDAYGDNLEASLYLEGFDSLKEPVFTLSDDGRGMNREDILEKWFVLGTDSKSRNDVDIKGINTLNKEPRVKMGEKGIGRLAVAYLGPQMMMLSKKSNFPLEAVFFDWRILENYDLFLADINIPIRIIDSVTTFRTTFPELKSEFLANFDQSPHYKRDPWFDQQELKAQIIEDCNNLRFPQFLVDNVIRDLVSESEKSHATRFVIFKPDPQILELKDFTKRTDRDNVDDTSVKHTVASLVGLFNLFKTESPAHKTHFWINNKGEEGRYDLLGFKSFFSPGDFLECDHLIDGTFDEEGRFDGEIRIYRKTIQHTFKPVRKKGKTNYGKFSIKLGYVQDLENETLVNDEQKKVFEEKLSFYSGLFIYRDGFRVLPYGRPDADFLQFEERRSTGAGTYFFSKRRMFGYIEISRNQNKNLKDKSSREGFVNNAAFRDFKADLIAFFKDLAKKYFATRAKYDYKREQQGEIKKLADAEKQERERDIEARKEFARKLRVLPKELVILSNEYDRLIDQLQSKVNDSDAVYSEIQGILSEIEICKTQIAEKALVRPSRFEPTKLQKKNFFEYNKMHGNAIKHFDDATALMSLVHAKLQVHELFEEFQSKAQFQRNRLSGYFSEFSERLKHTFERIDQDFNEENLSFVREFDTKYSAIIPEETDAEEISRSMDLLEKISSEMRERVFARVTPFLDHLDRISFDVNEDNLVGFYKMQFDEIKEEWSKTYELAQLGIAVEIIDHQFNTLYSQLAESIRSLKTYLLPSNESHSKYNNLDTAFTHLQENYKLLQPLYRTTGRIRREVSGRELKEYLDDFFADRIRENAIKFTITPRAAAWEVSSYESIFKPVLINVINNAIYWLQPVDRREIKIDLIEGKLLIMNSGEPIDDYMLEDVFKLFFSNRPDGRGIGLYLAKQSLNSIGFEIEATNDPKYNQISGACFCIYKINNQESTL